MSATSTTDSGFAGERPYTHEMVIIHRVFRRESRLLPRLVRAVPSGDTGRAATLAGYVQEYLGGLHHHHGLEDELVRPLLRERAEGHESLVARMETQHQDIDRGLAAVADALATWREDAGKDAGEALAAALDEHRTTLLEHLDHEEEFVLPLIAEHLTVAEWDLVGARGLETIPKNKVLLALGAILEDATPQERAFFLSRVPVVGRLAWKYVGQRQYARRCRELRGTPGPA